MSAGDGSKGPRLYGWAWITIEPERDAPGQWWLLIRRNNATGELAYHRCWAPPRAPARPRPRRRPPLDDRRVLQAAKTLAGLDQHQSLPMDQLAALDHPRDARLRVPRNRRRDRTSRNPKPTRKFADRVDLQRDQTTVQHLHRRTHTRPTTPAALVDLATTTPHSMKITNYGCRTSPHVQRSRWFVRPSPTSG